jgi:AAA+ superfamily predicted ATPase
MKPTGKFTQFLLQFSILIASSLGLRADGTETPKWYQDLEEAHRVGWDSTYLITGLSNELVYDDSTEGQHVLDYLRSKLLNPADYPVVIGYDPTVGFTVVDDLKTASKPTGMWARFRGQAKPIDSPAVSQWRKFTDALNQNKKLSLTEKLNMVEKEIQNSLSVHKVAFVTKFPDHVQGQQGERPHEKELKEVEQRLAKWASYRNDNHQWTERGFRSLILTSSKGNMPYLASDATQSWVNFETKISFPSQAEREAYVKRYLEAFPEVQQFVKVEPEVFGNLSGGLTIMDIQKMLVHSAKQKTEITANTIRDQRKEFIKERFGQFLEIADGKHTIQSMFGSDHLKEDLATLAEAMKARDPNLPIGQLLIGVQGTGKTYAVKAFAHDAGVPVVIMKNTFRGKYVGESEANIDKVLSFLKSLEMVAVQLPEADTMLGKGAEGGDNTGVDQRAFGTLNDAMSENRGKIFWFADSARPWNFQADTKSRFNTSSVSNQYSIAGKRGLFDEIAKQVEVKPGHTLHALLSQGGKLPNQVFPDEVFERMYGNPREIFKALSQGVLRMKYSPAAQKLIGANTEEAGKEIFRLLADTIVTWQPTVTDEEIIRTELHAALMTNEPRSLPDYAAKYHRTGQIGRLRELLDKVEGRVGFNGKQRLTELELAEFRAASFEEFKAKECEVNLSAVRAKKLPNVSTGDGDGI